MQINGMYEFARPLKTGPLRAEVFATGGEATIKTFNVFQYDPGKLVQPKR
jgi:hypothetical protein